MFDGEVSVRRRYVSFSQPAIDAAGRARYAALRRRRMRHMRQKIQTVSEHPGRQTGLLTTAEVAEQLRVHPRTVQRWLLSGRLRATRTGPKVWRIREEDLNAFLEAGRVTETR